MGWLGSVDDGDPLARVALDAGEIIPEVMKENGHNCSTSALFTKKGTISVFFFFSRTIG